LRKDFIIDPYQIFESRLLSADCVLLIADILTLEELKTFRELADGLGMEALVETHSEEDMKKAEASGARLIGINNRNLKTLIINTKIGEHLLTLAPKGATVVIESGIEHYEEIMKFKSLGAHAFLVGTSLMRAPNVIMQLHHLRGIGHAC
jgi:indole-3-glycerol phosphate synthase